MPGITTAPSNGLLRSASGSVGILFENKTPSFGAQKLQTIHMESVLTL